MDDSEAAQQGLSWTLANYLQPQDELHLIAVAQAVPFPVTPSEPLPGERKKKKKERKKRERDSSPHASPKLTETKVMEPEVIVF